jgi:hypothetical protein
MKLADAPPPGWYPDPEGTSRLRWWEGVDWADLYRARPTRTELEARQLGTYGGEIPGSSSPAAVRQAGALIAQAPDYRGAVRRDAEEIIAEVRKVARSEIDRAADVFSQRARTATRELQPLISEYSTKFFRWVKIALALAIVLTVAYVVFQAIAQQSIIDWILDRFDDDDSSKSGGAVAACMTIRWRRADSRGGRARG